MPKFRKRPVVIEAVQYDGTESSVIEILAMRGGASALRVEFDELLIPTLEGVFRASKGDWVIKGIKGELYPCKPDIFEATYEPCSLDKTACSDCDNTGWMHDKYGNVTGLCISCYLSR